MAKKADALSVDTVALAKGYAVVVLDQIHNVDSVPADQLTAVQQRLSSQYSEADYRALVELLKAKADISYHTAN
jgi:peptidyl-prolyl cis-trans isomerase D